MQSHADNSLLRAGILLISGLFWLLFVLSIVETYSTVVKAAREDADALPWTGYLTALAVGIIVALARARAAFQKATDRYLAYRPKHAMWQVSDT